MKVFVISDVHIKSETEGRGKKLLEFFHNLPEDTTHLVLLGDIFDIWIGPDRYYARKYPQIVSALKNIHGRGVEVHYFEGNHDLYLKNFWQKEMKFFVHEKDFYFQVGDKVVRAEHGDLMNPTDKGYLMLRSTLRSKIARFMMHLVPGSWIDFIGQKSSHASRSYSEKNYQDYKEKILKITRESAQKVFHEKPFDLLVTGHTHVDDDFSFEINGKTVRSLNLGSWLDQPKTLLITPEEHKIIRL
jgi:UDP-2,3-diacylglucosamine hydrolase